jgi:hypothetical protein
MRIKIKSRIKSKIKIGKLRSGEAAQKSEKRPRSELHPSSSLRLRKASRTWAAFS